MMPARSLQRARAGDIECTEAWNRYLDDLSNALVSLINILDPEIIAVGGGVSGAGDFLIVPLNERDCKRQLFQKTDACRKSSARQ